jgi:hypothetical protein
MFPETLLRILFSVIGRCSLCADLSLGAEKMCCHSGFLYDFTESRRFPVSTFNVKIADLGSLKQVNEMIFIISIVMSKEQAKVFSLISSSTKKQKTVKTIIACTESTYLLL